MPQSELSIAHHFADLPDPRIDRTKKHLLGDILVIAPGATNAGADSREQVERFGRAKHGGLKTLPDLPNGIPSHDTFDRVFARLDPRRFGEGIAGRMAAACEAARAAPRGTFSGRLHPVGAWAAENGLILGREAVADGSHEIAAVPELLKVPGLKGAPVTLDAAGCQTAIAGQIRDQGGDYLPASDSG